MVLALKRSAYSTNIKTRSDFSCAFFDAELRCGRAGVRPAGAPRLDGRAGAEGGPRRTAPERLGAGDMLVTNDPYPSGVHLNDVSLISPVHCEGELLGYVANLAHHVDVGGGAPASIGAFREVFQEGVIIPPVKLVAGGADRRRRLPARPGADPLEARDGGRLPRADRGERHRRAARPGARRRGTGATTIVATMARAARVHRAAHARRARRAAARRLRGRGRRRQRRLHRRAGAPRRRGSRSAPTASASTRPAPTRSGARRSTRPTR